MQKKFKKPIKKEAPPKQPEKAASNQKERDVFIASLKKQGLVDRKSVV